MNKMKQLIKSLESEAVKGKTCIDSFAYREAIGCGSRMVKQLSKSIKTGSGKHYLTLEALRMLSIGDYNQVSDETRIGIYTDMMRHAIVFNDWGMPSHGLNGETARRMIQSGDKALSFLEPLLMERRPATCLGSETATISKEYGNRVCDYALAMIREILDEDGDYPYDMNKRDLMIEELRQRLSLMTFSRHLPGEE